MTSKILKRWLNWNHGSHYNMYHCGEPFDDTLGTSVENCPTCIRQDVDPVQYFVKTVLDDEEYWKGSELE